MSKKKLSIAEEIKNQYVTDSNAETIREIMAQTGLSESAVSKFIKKRIQSGEYEQVLKRINGRILPAYRRKGK